MVMIIENDSLYFYNTVDPEKAPLHYKLETFQCIAEPRVHAKLYAEEEDEEEKITVKPVYIRASRACDTDGITSTF